MRYTLQINIHLSIPLFNVKSSKSNDYKYSKTMSLWYACQLNSQFCHFFFQIRAKARLHKLEKLADTNDKLKTLKAVKQLQQAAKHAAGQTTIIQASYFLQSFYLIVLKKRPDNGQGLTLEWFLSALSIVSTCERKGKFAYVSEKETLVLI